MGTHTDLFNFINGHCARFPETFDNRLRAHTLLHMLLNLLQYLSGKDYN